MSGPNASARRLYDALKEIGHDYQSPAEIRRSCEKQYGLDYATALEYAYENVIRRARQAVFRMRRPKA